MASALNETRNNKPIEGYSLLVIEIIIVVLNILAVTVIVRFKQKYNPDILIFSLALADLAKTCIPMTMTLAVYFGWEGMLKGTRACNFFGWSAFTTNSGIMMVMTLMALDRYAAICWPFEYKHEFTRKKIIFAICSIFVYVSVHSAWPLLPVVGVGYMMSYYNESFCHFELSSEDPRSRGYSIYILALGISMLLVVMFCYCRAMCSVKKLMKRQRRMSDGRGISRDEYRRRATTKMNVMFARMMIVMMFFFCFSWLPFLVVILFNLSGWKISPDAHFWSLRIAVINSLFNPIIGATMCKPYRMGYKYIICAIFRCCGLCSRTQAQDPWDRLRFYSVVSRGSVSARGSQQNDDRESGNYPSCNSGGDSGIDPDTFDHPGNVSGVKGASRLYGNKSPSNERTVNEEWKQDIRRVRPKILTKRISFMDDEPVKEGNPEAADEVLAAEDKVTALPRVPTGSTEGILKDRTSSKSRLIRRRLSEVLSRSPAFVQPFRRRSSLAGSFGQITPPPSPSNRHSRPRDISTGEGCKSNSLIGERLAEGGHVTFSASVPSPAHPSSPVWSLSLRRQSAPSAVEVTYFPVHSLNLIQTTALLSPVTPTQEHEGYATDSFDTTGRGVSPDLCQANPGVDESVTLCNDGKRDKRTAQRTDAQFEKNLQLADHNSAVSHLQDNNSTGVAQRVLDHTLADPYNNNRPRASDTSETYLLDTSLCSDEPDHNSPSRAGSASATREVRECVRLRGFSQGQQEVFC